jgi:drug/metabolite transporter (DMT)-like permease
MTAVLALVACGAWGYSTHAAARGARAWGTLRLTAWSQLAGLALMVPWLIVSRPSAVPDDALYGVLAGLGSGTSLALLYDACSRMSPGLAAAVSGVIAAVVPLIHTIAIGAPPSVFTAASLIPCIAGVTIVAVGRQPEAPAPKGTRAPGTIALYEAGLSGAAMGVYYIALARVGEPAFAVTEARIVATVLLLGVLLMWNPPARVSRPCRAPLATVALVGVFGAAGTIAYGYAADVSTLVSVVAIVSIAPAVTAWLGRWRADERLATVQVCGLLACVAGAALAAISTIGG